MSIHIYGAAAEVYRYCTEQSNTLEILLARLIADLASRISVILRLNVTPGF